jgi:predicted transport protein
MTAEQAQDWLHEGDIELLHNPFGDPPEATAEWAATIILRLPTSLKQRIDKAADKARLSRNAYIMKCQEYCLENDVLSAGAVTADEDDDDGSPTDVVPSGAVTFEDHESYTDHLRQPILRELRRRVWSIDDRLPANEQCTRGNRIAYKIPGKRIFLEVKVQRGAIKLHLADGGCPDPNGIAHDIPASHGWRQLKKLIRIKNISDLDAAMPFIKAAYRAEGH